MSIVIGSSSVIEPVAIAGGQERRSTISGNSSAASICAQCPQFGNTCSDAFGISLSAANAPSIGLTRSSRPQVSRVCWRSLCASRQSMPSSAVSGFQNDIPIEAIASRAPGRGGVGEPLLDELVGDQVLVDHHRGDERPHRLAGGVAAEVHQPLDALGRVGVEEVQREPAGAHQHQPADPVRVAEREPHRRTAAEAVAEQVHPLDAELVEQRARRGRRRTVVVAHDRRLVRAAEARAGRRAGCGTPRRTAAAPTRSCDHADAPGPPPCSITSGSPPPIGGRRPPRGRPAGRRRPLGLEAVRRVDSVDTVTSSWARQYIPGSILWPNS